MKSVRPKKYLGQHFLNDLNIAEKIVNALEVPPNCEDILEIGPGMGVLTNFLVEKKMGTIHVVEIDQESRTYLKEHLPVLEDRIYPDDFLKMDLASRFSSNYSIIGNFPYNISSQIYFKVLENRDQIPTVVGMIQREVAQRICSKEGSKVYGILSVLLQAFYDVEYLFDVSPEVFTPPPKVWSGVIRLKRNSRTELGCSEKLFFRTVKLAFQTRRKTLRNALKSLALPKEITSDSIFDKRAEQLNVEQFIRLTNLTDHNAAV